MTKLSKSKIDKELAPFDAQIALWCEEVGLRDQLDMLASMSTTFAGNRAKPGVKGSAECRMLILRQRGAIEAWIRQAYLEGLIFGLGHKMNERGRTAIMKRPKIEPAS